MASEPIPELHDPLAAALVPPQADIHAHLREVTSALAQVNGALEACIAEIETLHARVDELERERVAATR
jgi:hypothetical protein